MAINRQKQASEGEGNTKTSPSKQPTRHTFFSFTLFAKGMEAGDIDESTVQKRLVEIGKKGLYGREICPTTGRLHLQGFIHLKKAMRLTELKIPYNPHLEHCKGSEESNIKYCSKDGNVWSFGYPKEIKTPIIWNTWNTALYEEIKQSPDINRKIFWYWSENGKMGKTSFVRYAMVHNGAQYASGGKYTDVMNLIYHTDMDNCQCVIFGLPREHKNHISYSALEAIKDGIVSNMKSYQNGSKIFNPPHVVVFANYPPDLSAVSKDRWIIHQIDYMNGIKRDYDPR